MMRTVDIHTCDGCGKHVEVPSTTLRLAQGEQMVAVPSELDGWSTHSYPTLCPACNKEFRAWLRSRQFANARINES